MYWYQYREWVDITYRHSGKLYGYRMCSWALEQWSQNCCFWCFITTLILMKCTLRKGFQCASQLMLLIKASVNILWHFQCGMKNFTGDKHTSPIFPQHAHLPLGNTTGCLLRHWAPRASWTVHSNPILDGQCDGDGRIRFLLWTIDAVASI